MYIKRIELNQTPPLPPTKMETCKIYSGNYQNEPSKSLLLTTEVYDNDSKATRISANGNITHSTIKHYKESMSNLIDVTDQVCITLEKNQHGNNSTRHEEA